MKTTNLFYGGIIFIALCFSLNNVFGQATSSANANVPVTTSPLDYLGWSVTGYDLDFKVAGTKYMELNETINPGFFGISNTWTSFIQQSQLHQNVNGSNPTYHQFTNSTTGGGVAVNEGLRIGITGAGIAELRQWMNQPIDFYTNGTHYMRLRASGDLELMNASMSYMISGNRVLWHNNNINNIYVGVGAGATATGNNNTLVGNNAGTAVSGQANVCVGSGAGVNLTTSEFNVLVGFQAGAAMSTIAGFDNTFVGYRAGTSNTSGNHNAFYGDEAGIATTTGHENTYIGGHSGVRNVTGNHNVYVGYQAGEGVVNNSNDNNTFVGYHSGIGTSTGDTNVFLGYRSGITNTVGHDNTILGPNADVGSNNLQNSAAIGANAIVPNDFQMILGENGVNVGIGLSGSVAAGNNGPQAPLEINSDPTSYTYTGTGSGLRLRQLTTANTPVTNPGPGVLAVNNDGDVIYVPEPTGIGLCSNPIMLSGSIGTNFVNGSSQYNAYYVGQDANVNSRFQLTTPINTVALNTAMGIGFPCSSNLPGKLSVEQFVPSINVNVPTLAGYFRNGDESLNQSTSFDKRGIYAITDGTHTGDIPTNIGGDFEAVNCSARNIAVRGVAGRNPTLSPMSHTYGGYFEAINAIHNHGLRSSASGGTFATGIEAWGTYGTDVNTGMTTTAVGGNFAYGIISNISGTINNDAYGLDIQIPSIAVLGNNAYGANIKMKPSQAISSLGVNVDIDGTNMSGSFFGSVLMGVRSITHDGSFSIGVLGASSKASLFNIGMMAACADNSSPFANYGIYATQPTGNYTCIPNNCNNAAGVFNGWVYSTENFVPSDSALKDSIQPLTNAMNYINELQPKTFVYKTGDYPTVALPNNGRYAGLISQEVNTVMPELVKDFNMIPPLDTLGNIDTTTAMVSVKALDYTGIIPYLIGGLKELNSRGFGSCDVPVELQENIGMNLNDYNVYFEGQGDYTPPVTDDKGGKTGGSAKVNGSVSLASVGIGYPCYEVLPAKLSVNTTPTGVVSSPVIAGSFLNGAEEVEEAIGVQVTVSGQADYVTGMHVVTGDANNENYGALISTGNAATGDNYGAQIFTGNAGGSVYGVQILAGNAENESYGTISLAGNATDGNSYGAVILSGNSDNANSYGTISISGDGAFDNYGVYAITSGSGSGVNYGIYAEGPAGDCGFDTSSAFVCPNAAGFFNGDVGIVGNLSVASDAKLKENISPLSNTMDIINKLSPVSYTFKTRDFQSLNLPKKEQHGFIAQDIEKVLPELVKSYKVPAPISIDSSGRVTQSGTVTEIKTVDYLGLIPLLVNACKEQQATIDSLKSAQKTSIDELKEELNKLKEAIDNCCSRTEGSAAPKRDDVGSRMAIGVELNNAQAIILEQNVPNPFANETTINYTIPDNVKGAQIIFYDNLGRVLKMVDIKEKGLGSLKVYAPDLTSGIYTYSLIADGKLIETKKMVKQD